MNPDKNTQALNDELMELVSGGVQNDQQDQDDRVPFVLTDPTESHIVGRLK